MRTSSASRNASRKNRSLEPRTRGERAIVVGEKFSCWESWWWLRACRRACVFRCESERQGMTDCASSPRIKQLLGRVRNGSAEGTRLLGCTGNRKQQEYPLHVSHSPALTRNLRLFDRGSQRSTSPDVCISAARRSDELARGPPRACCAASPVSP